MEYRQLLDWVADTGMGDVEDLGARRPYIWDKVCSDSDACRAMKCGYYKECFYFRARQKWERVQIIVANHALVGINSMLTVNSKILPKADVLVVDEAHALDHVLSEVIGTTLSNRGFENILNRLLRIDERGIYRGLLSASQHLFSSITSLRTEMEILWQVSRNTLKDKETIRGAFQFTDLVIGISSSIKTFIDKIKTSCLGLFEENEEIELSAALLKLKAFSDGLESFVTDLEGHVRWVEIGENRIALRMAPIYPREFVLTSILPEFQSTIFTSATLSISGDFGFISQVLGVENAEKLTLPSPFNLKKQVVIEVKKGIDLKNQDGASKLADVVIHEASRKDGGILVLFTSRESMKRAWELSYRELIHLDRIPMLQGHLASKAMLETMRESENSVIFGLDSFWEGVDVKGDSLKCLIMTKLPFEVPTEPIVMARTEMIEKNGGNPFYEYSLPRAVLKFKQGFGRLIRSKTDTGRMIICDERIETKVYGNTFKRSLF